MATLHCPLSVNASLANEPVILSEVSNTNIKFGFTKALAVLKGLVASSGRAALALDENNAVAIAKLVTKLNLLNLETNPETNPETNLERSSVLRLPASVSCFLIEFFMINPNRYKFLVNKRLYIADRVFWPYHSGSHAVN